MTVVDDRPIAGTTEVVPPLYAEAMAVRKLSISMETKILAEARQAAEIEGMSLSTWLAKAAQDRAQLIIGRAALEEHFAQFGEPDPESVAEARAELRAAGFYEPVTPERAEANARALARLESLSEEI